MSECPAARRRVAAGRDGTVACVSGLKLTNQYFDGQRKLDHTTERHQHEGLRCPWKRGQWRIQEMTEADPGRERMEQITARRYHSRGK